MNDILLKKNLDFLRELNPPLTEMIENSKCLEDVTCDKDNFFMKYKSVTIPAYETMSKMKPILKDVIKNVSMERGQATVIVGAGYGHMFHEILKSKKKNHLVLLIEPSPYFLKETFSRYNIIKWIKDRTLFIVTSIEEIGIAISTIETFHVLNYWSLLVDPYTVNLPLVYADAVQKANEHINAVRCNTGTVMGAGKQMAQNDVESLPYVLRNRGVKELTDIFKGKPAILVSTGPSLLKNIWRLKEYQDKIIIVAVAQALRTLLAYDIKPDFITTVDYGDINYSHFEGLMDSDVPLICLNRTYAKILKQYKGTKFISGSHQPGFEDSTIGILEEKGWLDSGGSVAHFNMSAAILMGCDPLIFIGQDLSWTNKTHADTLDESGKVTVDNGLLFWEVTDPRSTLKKLKKMCIGQAIYVPGYFGAPVLTNIGLASFITSFEAMIKPLNKTVINSTEGGVHIQGTERMSLKDSLGKYAKNKIDKTVLDQLKTLAPDADNLIEEAIKRLKSDIELCDTIMKDGKMALDACINMEKLANQKRYSENSMKVMMETNELYSSKAEEAAKKCPLVAISILKTSRELHSNELHVEKTKAKNLLVDRSGLKIRIKRNKMIIEAARKAAKEVKGWCKKSLDILEKYNETKDGALLIEDSGYIPNLKDAEKFFDVGNWATPLIEARNCMSNVIDPLVTVDLRKELEVISKAEQMREDTIMKWKKEPDLSLQIQYQALMDKSRDLGMKEQKFDEALKLLEKARKLLPKEFPARWGIANSLTILKKTKQAIKEYEALLKDFPDNIDIQFEYGCALLDIDANKGLTKMIETMQKTDKYDHMFIHVGNLYMKSNEFEKAIEAYEMYLKKYPNDPNAKECLENAKTHVI
jgi:hypothetical protein